MGTWKRVKLKRVGNTSSTYCDYDWKNELRPNQMAAFCNSPRKSGRLSNIKLEHAVVGRSQGRLPGGKAIR